MWENQLVVLVVVQMFDHGGGGWGSSEDSKVIRFRIVLGAESTC